MQPVVFGGFAVMRSTDFGLKLVVVFYVTTTSRLMPVLVQYSRSFPGYLETCTVVLYSTQVFLMCGDSFDVYSTALYRLDSASHVSHLSWVRCALSWHRLHDRKKKRSRLIVRLKCQPGSWKAVC